MNDIIVHVDAHTDTRGPISHNLKHLKSKNAQIWTFFTEKFLKLINGGKI